MAKIAISTAACDKQMGVVCPRCKAKPGQRCHAPNGRKCDTHGARQMSYVKDISRPVFEERHGINLTMPKTGFEMPSLAKLARGRPMDDFGAGEEEMRKKVMALLADEASNYGITETGVAIIKALNKVNEL